MNTQERDYLITQHLGSNYEISPNAMFLYQDNNNIRLWTVVLTHTESDGSKKELKFSAEFNLDDVKAIPVTTQFATVLGMVKDHINGEANPTNGFFQ